ncbi:MULTISPECIES: hypothetical protein [unclassified Mesorhizobium]|uniref:hypothetical protein n=1 Tax=unclassified Mesorhizobium TaxID=325217 RepID=UPI001093D6C0|nr:MULTISPECIES: hypothetical protein [unclassified Mesorhizobium]TGT91723.1 hypothetical protein EN804_01220 [Mesorhizobium sp. M8A.F.Ca.ET.161.01.1.1]TGV44749.1 hypothetical protein EN785_01215 [Mesorhizobium sp. M8A.F.Ca.ET.142.01.1.1]
MARISEILGHNATSAIVGALAAGVVSWPVSYFVAVSSMKPAQDRQMRLEQLKDFSKDADTFISLGTKVVSRINVSQPLDDVKVAISDASGLQAVNTQSLISVFGAEIQPAAEGYQDALNKFVTTTNSLHEPGQIKSWVEAFDGVVNAQIALKERIYSELDVKPAERS